MAQIARDDSKENWTRKHTSGYFCLLFATVADGLGHVTDGDGQRLPEHRLATSTRKKSAHQIFRNVQPHNSACSQPRENCAVTVRVSFVGTVTDGRRTNNELRHEAKFAACFE